MTSLFRWVAEATRTPDREPHVHFHGGTGSLPAACYDEHCRNPRLDVAR